MSVLLTCRSVLTIACKTFYLVSILNEGEYCKSSIKPPGALFISILFEGGGGGGGGLIQFSKEDGISSP